MSYSQNINYKVYDRQYYTGNGNTDFWTDDDPRWKLLVYDNTDGYTSFAGVVWMVDDGIDGPSWFDPADGVLRTSNNTAATGIKVSLEGWEDDNCGAANQYNTGCWNDDENHCGPSTSGVISFRNDPVCQWNNYQYDCSSAWKAQYKIYWEWANAPSIVTQPTSGGSDRTLCIGNSTTLTVAGDASATFYQWQSNTSTGAPQGGCSVSGWANIAGATAASYVPPQTAGTRLYRVLVTSNCTADFTSKTTTSECVRVTYFPYAPSVQGVACGTTVFTNSSATFYISTPPSAGAMANQSGLTWSCTGASSIICSPGANGTSTATSATITFNGTPGTYSVILTVNDACGAADATSSCSVTTVSDNSCNTVYMATAGSGGSDANPGTPTLPVLTLTKAMTLVTASRNVIKIATGAYTQTSIVNLTSNLLIDGKYTVSGGNWTKSSANTTTITFTSAAQEDINANSGHLAAFKGNGVSGWTLQDLNIITNNASGTTTSGRGRSNYAILLIGSCNNYSVKRCTISVGNGASGAAGTTPAGSGGAGGGGAGGTTGGAANAGCSKCGTNGAAGSAGNCGAAGGAGGGRCCSSGCNWYGCNASGCTAANGGNGTAGAAGAAPGAAPGAPAASANYYVPNGQSSSGNNGCGGGGGGKGGGGSSGTCCTCTCGPIWATGGNGGAGGGGGLGGYGGWGGGGSFGIYATGAGTGTLTDCSITAGSAGSGGAGGAGQSGSAGSAGANGADNTPWCDGGKGGRGGNGGNGGAGGTGVAGASGLASTTVALSSAVINWSGASVPNPTTVTIPFTTYQGCINSEITMTKAAGSWVLPGGLSFINDVNSGSSSYSTAASPVIVTTGSTGSYNIGANGGTYNGFLNITNSTRTLPTITVSPNPVCNSSTFTATAGNLSGTTLEYDWRVFNSNANTPDGPGLTSTVASPTFTVTGAGTYNIRLRVKEQCCGWSAPVYSSVTISTDLTAGAISANQTICNGGDPATLNNVTLPTGGNGSISYAWEYQDDCTGLWTAISGATSSTYDPPSGLTTTRCYRRAETNTCGTVYAPSVTITVLSVFSSGNIAGDGDLCSGDDPLPLTATPSGGSGSYSYQWQSQTGTGCPATGWTDIPGATGSTYDPPSGITSTTIFRCLIDDIGSPDCSAQAASSNCVTVTVTPNGYWRGIVSSDWFTAANWCGGVPTSTSDVIITTNANNMPVIGAAGAVCRSINIYNGASLTISTSDNLDIYGDWTNTGSFSNGTGSVSFIAAIPQGINGNTTTFNNLIINNSSATGITLNTAANVSGILTLTDGYIYTTAANILTLTNTSSATSGSAASYVIGPLVKQGNTDFVFPVGKGTKWARIGIFNITSSSDFRAEYYNTPYTDITTVASPLQIVSGLEHWILDRVAGSGEAEVRLYWEDASWSDILDCSQNGTLVVAHWTGGTWNDRGSPSVAGGCGNPAPFSGWIQSNAATTFSPFTFGSKNWQINPLPVKLIYFTAECNPAGQIDIKWTTASELNNDYFIIERSTDGINFSAAGIAKGNNNSNTITSYSFIDKPDIENYADTIFYYRLRQRDFDGTTEISETITVSCNLMANSRLNIYPNPAKNKVFITVNSDETIKDGELFISDVIGKKYFSRKIAIKKGRNTFELNTRDVASGSYFVNLQFENGKLLTEKLSVE